jgi:membrane-bound metal-dependent hydrolase YbcI (DUF457 family)
MFIGHFGVGLGAKKAAPGVSLGMLFLAAQFLDLLWPTFLLLGWERVGIEPGNTAMTPLNFSYYPISHSLFMAIVWGILIGLGYYLIRRNSKNAIIIALLVLSHWILDLLVHRPDLPLFFGSSMKVGLGIWNNVALAVILEGLIFVTGLILYLNATKARNRIGSLGFWIMIILLVAIHLNNLFGPPPGNAKAIAWAAELQWLFVLWAFWVDRHREPRTRPSHHAVAGTENS